MKEGENLMDVNYCEVCPDRCEKDGKLTCGADDAHRDYDLTLREWILPEWCPAANGDSSLHSE